MSQIGTLYATRFPVKSHTAIERPNGSAWGARHCEEPTGPAFGEPNDKLRDEAIHCHRCSGCGLLRGACHRSRIRATRWLAMTEALACPLHISNSPPRADTASRSRRAFRARFAKNVPLSDIRGRRECRALDAPAASYANEKAHERSHHGHTGTTRHSPRNGFTVSFVLFPVTTLV
jgi:hypothetical protein